MEIISTQLTAFCEAYRVSSSNGAGHLQRLVEAPPSYGHERARRRQWGDSYVIAFSLCANQELYFACVDFSIVVASDAFKGKASDSLQARRLCG